MKLAVYLKEQRAEKELDEKALDEWEKRLKQVRAVQHDLQVHLESLPDLSSIESVIELVPLPSAGDLFASSSSTGGSSFHPFINMD